VIVNKVKDENMNSDRWEGNWMQVKGNVRAAWGRLTHDHLNVMAGRRDCLAGKIQERRGLCSDEAKKQPVDWHKRMQG
jgi:uncharacterized protein YjbJ (UPF0337 family)